MPRQPSVLGSLASLSEDVIKQFESAWQAGRRPDITEFLVLCNDSRQELLIELVHVDLEFRFRQMETTSVEEYLQRFPQLLEDRQQVIDLIGAEYYLSNRYGQTVSRESVLARFPQYREALEAVLSPGESTETWPRRRPPRGPVILPQIPGYVIEEELGRGGMGVVYRATQPTLQRTVAIKTLLYGVASTAELRNRFRNEAEAIARLDHPHIVPVYEVGEWTPPGAGTVVPYFVMKFYAGGNLATEPSGPGTDHVQHATTVETIAHAVHHAHQRGILHRDLKPSNILLDEKGQPHVVDFGLAGRFDPNDPQSMTAAVMGTPAYMAPEQARSPSQITTAADVYGLGAILYHLLTGQPPFRIDTPLAVLEQVVHESPVRPSLLNARIPRDLETICLKCLEKEPGRRYDSPAALALDLERLRTGQSIMARPLPSWERAWRTVRRHPVISSLMLLTFGVLIASIAVLAHSNMRIREQEQETRDALKREQWTHTELMSTFNREQQMLYGKRISSVGRLWATNQLPQAWTELDQCPLHYRGWEWRYYNNLRIDEPTRLSFVDRVVRSVAFLSATEIITGDSEGTVTIWDWPSKTAKASWKGIPQEVRHLTVYPRKKWLAVCDQDNVAVWNYETQKQLAMLPGSMWVAFSPDGAYLGSTRTLSTTDPGKEAIVWETSTWKQKWLFKGHTAVVLNGTMSPDSKTLATCSSDRTIRRWNLADGNPVGEPWKRPLPVFRLAYLGDGKHIAEAHPSSMAWSDAETGKELGRYNWNALNQPVVITGRVQVTAGADPDIIAFSGPSHDIQLWNIKTNRSIAVFRGHNLHIGALEMSPDGKQLVTASNDLTVRIWERQQQREFQSLGSVGFVAYDIALSADGQFLAVVPNFHAPFMGKDEVCVLRTTDGSEAGRFPGVGTALFTSDGSLMTALPEGGVACWNLQTREKLWQYEAPKQRCTSLGQNVDSKVITVVQQNGQIVSLDAKTGAVSSELQLDEQSMGTASYAPKTHQLAFVGKREVELWDLATSSKVYGFPMNSTRKLAYSPDGMLIAAAEADRVIRLRHAKSGTLVLTFPGHPRTINSLAFSADGKRLVSSCTDGLIRIWDVETGQELTALPGHFEESVLVTWDHAKDQIIAVDTKVHIWQAPLR